MTDLKDKMYRMLDEAISPEAEVVNFKALHDLLAATIEYQINEYLASDGNIESTDGQNETAGDSTSQHASTHVNDQKNDDQQHSDVGWITKSSDCCDDLNRKIFGTIKSERNSTASSKHDQSNDIRGRVESLDDKLDDFVSNISNRTSSIEKRVKHLENPSKKLGFEDL